MQHAIPLSRRRSAARGARATVQGGREATVREGLRLDQHRPYRGPGRARAQHAVQLRTRQARAGPGADPEGGPARGRACGRDRRALRESGRGADARDHRGGPGGVHGPGHAALMFRSGSGPVAEAPQGPDSPFHPIVVNVETVVRDGIARGEFRDVGDVPLAVELLSGAMRAGAERIGGDPGALAATSARRGRSSHVSWPPARISARRPTYSTHGMPPPSETSGQIQARISRIP